LARRRNPLARLVEEVKCARVAEDQDAAVGRALARATLTPREAHDVVQRGARLGVGLAPRCGTPRCTYGGRTGTVPCSVF
jgi:hypothetical protein